MAGDPPARSRICGEKTVAWVDSNHSAGSRTVSSTFAFGYAAVSSRQRARIVDRRLVTRENALPVGPAVRCFEPAGDAREVRPDLDHVVAGAEAELLERDFERQGSGPAEAGTDDLQRHELFPLVREHCEAHGG